MGYIDNSAPDENKLMQKFRSQHAAIFTIRDALQEKIRMAGHAEKNIPILTQDPQYDEWDGIVLDKHGMTVVDGGYGHHEGFLQADRNTMIVDTSCGAVNIVAPALEFTEPAVILGLNAIYYDVKHAIAPRACWYALDQETNTPILVPGQLTM
jgi:hypothetical protein